jgi:hypothetical protein
VGQTPFLDYLPTFSSPFALIRSVVDEMGIFRLLFSGLPAMTAFRDPRLTSPWLSLGFFNSSNERTLNAFAISR